MSSEQKCVSVWAWMRAVKAAPQEVLDVVTKAVLYTLALYADPDGGSCFPGQERLAEDCGLHVRTVKRKLQKAREAGYLRAHTRRYGMLKTSNLYELLIPEKAVLEGESGKPADEGGPRVPTKGAPVSPRLGGPRVPLPAQQSRPLQSTGISNARARMRDGGKAGHQPMTRMQEATAGRLVELWKDVRSLMGGEAPRTWSLREGSYAEMTTALAWTLFNKKLNYKAGTPIRDIAAYFVTMLRMVRHEEKTATTWTRDELWQLMASDLSPDEFRKPPKA